MFLTEWFGNGYVGNAAPKAFHVRPGVALDERGARLHKINTDQPAQILRGTEPVSPPADGVHWFTCSGAPLDNTTRPEEVRHLLRANTRAAIERVMPEYVVIDGWQPEGENEPRIPALMRKLGYRSATFKMSVINPQRGDRRDWHMLVGKRVNKTKTFKQLNDAVFATRQWRDIEFGHATRGWKLTDKQVDILHTNHTGDDYHILYDANRAGARFQAAMDDFCPVKIEQTREYHVVTLGNTIRPLNDNERAKMLGLENAAAEYDSICHAVDSRIVALILRSIWYDANGK